MTNYYTNVAPTNVGGQPFSIVPVLESEQEKSRIRICEAEQKARIQIEKQLVLDEERFLRREKRRLVKETEYKEVYLNSAGEVQVLTKNAIVSQGPCRICNFSNPQLYYLNENTNGESGVYLLEFTIGKEQKEIYFKAEKIGIGKELLKKIRSVGGQIFCRKEKDAESFINNLMVYLLTLVKEKTIPSDLGWNKYKDNQFYFVEEGETTWNKVIQLAR